MHHHHPQIMVGVFVFVFLANLTCGVVGVEWSRSAYLLYDVGWLAVLLKIRIIQYTKRSYSTNNHQYSTCRSSCAPLSVQPWCNKCCCCCYCLRLLHRPATATVVVQKRVRPRRRHGRFIPFFDSNSGTHTHTHRPCTDQTLHRHHFISKAKTHGNWTPTPTDMTPDLQMTRDFLKFRLDAHFYVFESNCSTIRTVEKDFWVFGLGVQYSTRMCDPVTKARDAHFVETYETCTEDHEPMNNEVAHGAARCSSLQQQQRRRSVICSKDKTPPRFLHGTFLSSHNDEIVE